MWHYWYPAYDCGQAVHSPGLILLWKMIEWAASNAIDWIDLGSGETRYKTSFGTRDIDVAEASVLKPSISGITLSVRTRGVRAMRSTRLHNLALRARDAVVTAARRYYPPWDQTGRS